MLVTRQLFLKLSFLIFMVGLDAINTRSIPEQNENPFTIVKQRNKKDSKIQMNSGPKPAYLAVEQEQELEFYHNHQNSYPSYLSQGSSGLNQSQHTSLEDTLSEIQAIKNVLQKKPLKSGDKNHSKSLEKKPKLNTNVVPLVRLNEYALFLEQLYRNIAPGRDAESFTTSKPIQFNEYPAFLDMLYKNISQNCHEKLFNTTKHPRTTAESYDVDQQNVKNGMNIRDIHIGNRILNFITVHKNEINRDNSTGDSDINDRKIVTNINFTVKPINAILNNSNFVNNDVKSVHFTEYSDKNENKGTATNITNKNIKAITNNFSNVKNEIKSVKITEYFDNNDSKGITTSTTNISNNTSNAISNNTFSVVLGSRDPNLNFGKKEKKPIYIIVRDDSDVTNHTINTISHIMAHGVYNVITNKDTETKLEVIKPSDETTLSPMGPSPENPVHAHNSFNGNSMSFKINLNVLPLNRENISSETSTEQRAHTDHLLIVNESMTTANNSREMTQRPYINDELILNNKSRGEVYHIMKSIENMENKFMKTDKPMDFTTSFSVKKEKSTINLMNITNVTDHSDIKNQGWHASTINFGETLYKYPEVKVSLENGKTFPKNTEKPKDQDNSSNSNILLPWMVAALSYMQQGKPIPEGLKRFIAIKGGKIPVELKKVYSTSTIINSEKQSVSPSDPFKRPQQGGKITSKLPPLTTDMNATKTVPTIANNNPERSLNADQSDVEARYFNPHWVQRGEGYSTVTVSFGKKTSVDPEESGTSVLEPHIEDQTALVNSLISVSKNIKSSPTGAETVAPHEKDVTEKMKSLFAGTIKTTEITDQTRPKPNNTRTACRSRLKPIVVTTIERSNYIPRSDKRFVHFDKTENIINVGS